MHVPPSSRRRRARAVGIGAVALQSVIGAVAAVGEYTRHLRAGGFTSMVQRVDSELELVTASCDGTQTPL